MTLTILYDGLRSVQSAAHVIIIFSIAYTLSIQWNYLNLYAWRAEPEKARNQI